MRLQVRIHDRHRSAKLAFTLVEVLVVLVLMSILSAMVMTAVRGVTNSARIARTRSIIATIDSVIQDQYEDYKYRSLPIVIPDLVPSGSLPDPIVGQELLPNEAARVRVSMVRDLQRMEMPDKVTDVRSPANRANPSLPVPLTGAADIIVQLPNGRIALRRGETGSLSDRRQLSVNWYTTGTNLPPKFLSYFRSTSNVWSTTHQGAECLYLIMANTYVDGTPAIEMIPSSNIGDLDNDGVPEILDGWGRPLGFVRWPVGYARPGFDSSPTIPLPPDEFDPFLTDFSQLSPMPTGLAAITPMQLQRPRSTRPLIISAGPDGSFGIAFSTRSSDFITEEVDFSNASAIAEETNYATQTWPVTDPWMGDERLGRVSPPPYFFPDPFLRQFIVASSGSFLLPGGTLAGPTASAFRDDNISNLELEVTE